MAHVDPEQLQRYLDGELRKGGARAVEKHLEGCAECEAAAERASSVGRLLRQSAEELADAAPLDGLADAVMARLRADEPLPWGERARAWLGEFLRHQKKIWVPPLVAAGAAAGAIAALVGVGPTQPPGAVDLPPGSNVLTVSFGQSVGGTLFQVEGKDGSTTAVIWVDEGHMDSEVKQT